jgi:hypothetical protein
MGSRGARRNGRAACRLIRLAGSARFVCGSALGFHLLLGPDFPKMASNLTRSLAEHRVEVITAVAERM